MITCSMPAATTSSTAYWMIGLSTRGSISLGWAFVAGRKRVPQPAAGKTALRTRMEPRTTRIRATAGRATMSPVSPGSASIRGPPRPTGPACSAGPRPARRDARSGGPARRLVRLGRLTAALEEGRCGQDEGTARDLQGTQQLGEEDRREDRAGQRLDQRDDRGAGGADRPDPEQEEKRGDRCPGEAGPEEQRQRGRRAERDQGTLDRAGRE